MLRGAGYGITYDFDFKLGNLNVSSIANTSNIRRAGRRLAGNAFVCAVSHGMQLAVVSAGGKSGGHFWPSLGMYVSPHENDLLKDWMAPRLNALAAYGDWCDYPKIKGLSALPMPQAITTLARMRGEIPFDVAGFSRLLKLDPVTSIHTIWDYMRDGIIRQKTIQGRADVPVMSPGQFVLLGAHFTAYARLTDAKQMRSIQRFTRVPQTTSVPQVPLV